MSKLTLAAFILCLTPAAVYALALLRLEATLRARDKAGARPDWKLP
jgi:hypothetical protein